jgi:hypothetical protein
MDSRWICCVFFFWLVVCLFSLLLFLPFFTCRTASESPAPGGGSVAAYVGTLGAALGVMVANLASHKPGTQLKAMF